MSQYPARYPVWEEFPINYTHCSLWPVKTNLNYTEEIIDAIKFVVDHMSGDHKI